MKIVNDWIKAIRKGYKEKTLKVIDKDLRIVVQLLAKGKRAVSSAAPRMVRDPWVVAVPRLMSLERNLTKRKKKLEEVT